MSQINSSHQKIEKFTDWKILEICFLFDMYGKLSFLSYDMYNFYGKLTHG